MNKQQEIWWCQSKADHDVFVLLRRKGMARCHALHYLQMVAEKIAKAFFWRSGSPPPRSHAGFVQFLRILGGQLRQSDRERIASLFSFRRYEDFQNWIRSALPIAYELERLAPDLAGDGPNPEYPWPHTNPQFAPASYKFPVWNSLEASQGRGLMKMIQIAVDRFAEYADT